MGNVSVEKVLSLSQLLLLLTFKNEVTERKKMRDTLRNKVYGQN